MSVRAINMWVPGRDCVCVKRRMGGGGFGVWGWGGLETPFFPPALMQTGIASVMIVYGICALQRIVRRSDSNNYSATAEHYSCGVTPIKSPAFQSCIPSTKKKKKRMKATTPST